MKYFLETSDTIPKGVGFSHFSPLHLGWIAAFLLTAILCSRVYRKSDEKHRERIRHVFAMLIVSDELFKMAGLFIGGNYEPAYLPFHLCSINIFIIAIQAFHPSKLLDNFLYAICIPAAIAAILFPTWTKLPLLNFMHLHSFSIHILLAVYPIMLTVDKDICPQPKQLPRCVALLLAMAIPVYGINLLFDTNFMFLMRADTGNPLKVFEQIFGSHLVGYLILIPIVFAFMYTLYWLLTRKSCRLASI